jgi:protoheme IX farnesyltransferase
MSQVIGKTPDMLVLDAAAVEPQTQPSLLADYIQMAKPRITVMVVITTFVGYAMASRSSGLPVAESFADLMRLVAALAGTALSCMSASVFNQCVERHTDRLMPRTANRPLPAGRIALTPALVYGMTLGFCGLALLLSSTTALAAALSAFTIASYVLIYTPMKRMSHASTIVGAVPGALPPVIGAAAATGAVGIEAILLFAILFLWQLPHFLAIAWLYRDQYAAAGMPMLPVIHPDGASTFRQILLGCMTLLPLGLLPTMMGVSGTVYLAGAFLAGLAFLASGVALVLGRTRFHARLAFFTSLIYLPVVFALMLVDQV